ncbi:hypothetical protein SPSIL_052660 [Sporomusa silvacetica DSM 10669]|uniref:HTH cro/C1-type domain-containing protein n=1 Tax=Sporomusa silvacetica DSM 10669 TaxID=1123289 RepID=A0ABZ3IU78_9FIRM|nr:helix-turn-helix protein [Sporomusa silvacetica DSM 10669]
MRQLRLKLELSQEAVAGKIGVSASLVSRLETGKPVRRRHMIETSYRTALEADKLPKQIELQQIDLDISQCLYRGRKCI